MKRFFSVLLAANMLLGSLAVSSFADTPSEEIKSNIASSVSDKEASVFGYIEDTPQIIKDTVAERQKESETVNSIPSLNATASSTESAYSSVTKGLVSSIKNQSIYGLCWDFSATAAAESSLLASKERNSLIDLSELQLVYNMYGQEKQDPLGNANGDSVIPTGDDWVLGGNNLWAIWAMAGWSNGTEEVNMPYSDITSDLEEGYNGENDTAHLKNARIIYYEAKTDDDGSVTAVGENKDIKDAIINNGAVSISYDHAFVWYETEEDMENKQNAIEGYSTEYKSFYMNSPYYDGGGHTITLVGWNDDFPADYFTTTAPGNGAWLVKNSWGDTWGTDGDCEYDDYATAEAQGYYWISYYDRGIADNGIAFEYKFEKTEYDNNYHYDGGCASGYLTLGQSYSVGASYEIKASDYETIKAASIGLYSDTNYYSMQLYRIENLDDNPIEDGTPLLENEVTGFIEYPGYYTIEIPEDEQPTLKKGEYFAVVFSLYGEYGINVAVDTNKDLGLLYFSADTSNDMTYVYLNNRFVPLNGEDLLTVRVKAFTTNVGEPDEIILNSSSADIFCDIKGENTAELYPVGENIDDYTYTWKSSNNGIARVDKNGIVKAVSQGECTVTMTAKKKGAKPITASCKVTVHKTTKYLKTDKTKITATTDGKYSYITLSSTKNSTTNIYVEGAEYVHGGKFWDQKDKGYTDAYFINGMLLRFNGNTVRVEIWDAASCVGKTTEVKFVDKYTGVSAKCYITVKSSISGMSCDSSIILTNNEAAYLNLTLEGDCSNYNISQKSSDSKVKLTRCKVTENDDNTVTITYKVSYVGALSKITDATLTFTDKVSGYSAQCNAYICANKGITMSKTELALSVGQSEMLNITNCGKLKGLTVWTSSDNSVASVKNGNVTAKSEGICVITAYSLTGYASCIVEVSE